MSVRISSKDITTGTMGNGTWQMTSTLRGRYVLFEQYFEVGKIPIQSGGNVVFKFTDYLNNVITVTIAGSIWTGNDIPSNLLILQNLLNLASTTVFTLSWDADNNQGTLMTNHLITVDFDDVLQTGIFLFGFRLDGVYIANNIPIYPYALDPYPRYINLYITETSSRYTTAIDDYPSLIIATRDSAFLQQNLVFLSGVNILHLAFTRQGQANRPLLFGNDWDLFFKPA